MENTALSKFVEYCVYDYNNSLQKYKESMGTFSSIERISNNHLKLETKKGDIGKRDIDCINKEEGLELKGELNKTEFKKLVSNNDDLINFLQNYKGNFFSVIKDRFSGKRKQNIFKGIKSLYSLLPYEPTHISTEGIHVRYEINVRNYIFDLAIIFQVKSIKNSSESVLNCIINDQELYSIFDSRVTDTIFKEELNDLKTDLPTSVEKNYKFEPDNIKRVFEYILYNYPKILEEELYESYSEANALDRLEIIKQNHHY